MISNESRRGIILLAALCMLGFVILAEAVRFDGGIVSFDQALATALHQGATPGMIVAMRAISWLGLQALWVLLAIAGLVYLLRRRWLPLALLVTSWTGGVVLNTVSKAVFVRPRPVFDVPLLTAMFYSFPSGHAMLSAIVYGMFAYLLARQAKSARQRLAIFFAAATLIALISFSRLYLGVHYFSDVAGGILLGTAWLLVCILGLPIASNLVRAYHRPVGDKSDRLPINDNARRQNDGR